MSSIGDSSSMGIGGVGNTEGLGKAQPKESVEDLESNIDKMGQIDGAFKSGKTAAGSDSDNMQNLLMAIEGHNLDGLSKDVGNAGSVKASTLNSVFIKR